MSLHMPLPLSTSPAWMWPTIPIGGVGDPSVRNARQDCLSNSSSFRSPTGRKEFFHQLRGGCEPEKIRISKKKTGNQPARMINFNWDSGLKQQKKQLIRLSIEPPKWGFNQLKPIVVWETILCWGSNEINTTGNTTKNVDVTDQHS